MGSYFIQFLLKPYTYQKFSLTVTHSIVSDSQHFNNIAWVLALLHQPHRTVNFNFIKYSTTTKKKKKRTNYHKIVFRTVRSSVTNKFPPNEIYLIKMLLPNVS